MTRSGAQACCACRAAAWSSRRASAPPVTSRRLDADEATSESSTSGAKFALELATSGLASGQLAGGLLLGGAFGGTIVGLQLDFHSNSLALGYVGRFRYTALSSATGLQAPEPDVELRRRRASAAFESGRSVDA